ncbi:hypothetical protein GN244_ATG02689 [Phytophthora infestans]|uniref:RxLR effector protein n=1 Tax=Phytophthora infestans TaxID=4787 RepID=A0A833SBF3_PHYIN|nr:hypothetical protein GN244_ATG02689 [Phytophthora infestans]
MENYVKNLNSKNRNSKASMIGVFTTHYGDEAVASALVAAEKNAKTTEAANTIKQLRKDQLSAWLTSKVSIDDVFHLLKFRDDGYAVLASSKMEVLDDYMRLFNREKSGHETLLDVLTKGYVGEGYLTKVLERGKKDASTSELATALENALFNKWSVENLRSEDVLKKLGLGRDMKKVLFDSNRDILTRYISMYNAKNAESMTSLIQTLSTHYGDGIVAGTLVIASWDKNTETLARQLRSDQLTEWLTSQTSVAEVFPRLKLGDDRYPDLIDPKVEVLDDYIKLFNREKSGQETCSMPLQRASVETTFF